MTPLLLLVCLYGGLLAGGLRDPWAWTAVAAILWLLALSSRRFSADALRPWLPWLLWAALSLLLSDQPLKSLYAFSRWTGVLAFFVLIRSYWGDSERRLWLKGLCGAGLVLGLAALWTGRGGLINHGEQMTGLLPPYYNYTMFVEAALAAALLAVLGRRDGPEGIWRKASWGLLAFAVGILLLARARAAVLAVLVSAAVGAYRQGQVRRLLIPAGLLLAAGFCVTAFAVSRGGASPAYLLKLDRIRSFQRPRIWRSALQAAGDHPWFGNGPGNFEAGFLRHNFVSRVGATNYQYATAYAHSEPLQLAAETGWPGLLFFLLALAACLKAPGRAPPSLEGEAALSALIAMGAHCAVDNMLQIPALAMLFFSALAWDKTGRAAEPGPVLKAAAWAGLLLALAAWVPQWLVDKSAALAREAGPQRRLELAVRSARIFPADDRLREELARTQLAQVPPRIDAALAELEKASRLNPTNALYPAAMAELWRERGDWRRALGLADEALALEPNFLRVRLLRAEGWARAGRKQEAVGELAEVLSRRETLERSAREVGASGYDRSVAAFDPGFFERVARLSR